MLKILTKLVPEFSKSLMKYYPILQSFKLTMYPFIIQILNYDAQ